MKNTGIFHIAMTNQSGRHEKNTRNVSTGLLKSCAEDKSCTIHRVVTFHKTKEEPKPKVVEKNMYAIPVRNKSGKIQINTLLAKEDPECVVMNELGPQEDFVKYQEPKQQDATVDAKVLQDLERLLKENPDASAQDETQISNTPLIKMSIDTGDHKPIVKLMNKVLKGLSFAIAYLDDIYIFSEMPEQHLAHIRNVLKRLQAANLRMKRSKCSFFKKELHYLGHLITTEGIKPQLEKVKAFSELKPPKHRKVKGKDAHLYSTTRSTVSPVSYQWNASHYLPSGATPPNLGVKIPGSCQHTHAGWGLTCLPSNAMALPVLIYTWVE